MKQSQKIRIACANGVRTVAEYARYVKAIRDPKYRDVATMQGEMK